MRDITSWRFQLEKELGPRLKDTSIKAKRFLDMELSLFLLELLGYAGNPYDGWALFSGYDFNHTVYNRLFEEQKQAIANAKLYLQFYKTSFLYRDYLDRYLKTPERVRLYRLNEETHQLERVETSIATNRTTIYENTLMNAPKHKKEEVNWFEGGDCYFDYEEKTEGIKVPEAWGTTKVTKTPTINIESKKSREPLKITLSELIEAAEFMDEKLGGHTYKTIIKRLSFINFKNGSSIEEQCFIIDGLSHMVGMVGAGKSTLMKVLAVLTSRKGMHITLVLDSIAAIFDMLSMMEKLEIKAAPLWGLSNREDHIKKLVTISSEETLTDIQFNELYKWVSEVCPLDGIRSDTSVNRVFRAGSQPCNRLRKEINSKEKFSCPMYYKCPVHYSEISLAEASVYIATPASFIHSWVPAQVFPVKMRVSELIYRKSDIIVFDEADRVQINFDSFFAPSEILLDETGTSWMNRLGSRVSEAYFGSGRVQLRNRTASGWYEDSNRAQRILDAIYKLLSQNRKIFNWIKGKYFSANSLIYTFVHEQGDSEDLKQELNEFRKDPFERGKQHELGLITKDIIADDESVRIKANLEAWCSDYNINCNEDNSDKLKLILLAAALEWSLKRVVDSWEEAEEAFYLSLENIPFFTNHLKDYSSFIPEAPMGNIFGFRYSANKDNNPGTLYAVRTMGVGRWLLTNYHDLLVRSEGIYGPHTILLSGTSWAPESANYNIDIQPTTMLKGQDNEMMAIEKSEFYFTPAEINGEVISVSGSEGDERLLKLSKLLKYLSTPNMSQAAGGKSIFQHELDKLPEDRKRILLLVGSYEEAKYVKEYLLEHLTKQKDWNKEHIFSMVRDDSDDLDENSIQRGVVNTFAQKQARILIAPLLSIERGHNILNEANVAAIGSAFFLIRPMPVPNDLKNNIYYINKWAMKYVKNTAWINEMETSVNLASIVREFRKRARRVFETKLWHSEKEYYGSMKDEDRESLCWTQLVVIWQVIGRLVRGGVPARVHFCDGKFAPNSAAGKLDTAKTSLLVGMREVLQKYFEEASNVKEIERQIAYQLYKPLNKALNNIRGVEYSGE